MKAGRKTEGAASVTRRLVLVFPGFEPLTAAEHRDRFVREARKAAPLYRLTLRFDEPASAEDSAGAELSVTARSPAGVVHTDLVFYDLGAINAFYAGRAFPVRIVSGLAAMLDFLVTGTFFRLVRASWRYGLFFLYPLVMAALVVAAGAFVARIGLGTAGIGGVVPFLVFTAALAAAFAALTEQRLYLLLLMDHWTYARDMARRPPQAVRELVERAGEDARRRIGRAGAAEVVLAGHSFGPAVAVMAASRAQAHDGDGPHLFFVGSTLLTIALHPAARSLRAAAAKLVPGRGVWLDVQAMTDPINYFRVDPAAVLGLGDGHVRLMGVRFRHQMHETSYRARRRDFFRMHRQFVYGVERWTPYSFHAILLGPEPFAAVARDGGLPPALSASADPARDSA